ncbi:MAG: hypothetical protein ACRC6N_11290 [Plesiomonas sp.]|uniref:helix-hairpin-helix domain-containing protein n=1 Tax=Plesiomonas sp. TaxID=2486279 RepID=UPI003F32C7FB
MSECVAIGQELSLPTPETLSIQINEIIAGLTFCEKRISADDLFKGRMTRLMSDVEVLAGEIESLLQNQADEQDALVGILEERDNEILSLKLRISILSCDIEILKSGVSGAIQETKDIAALVRKEAQDAITKTGMEHAKVKSDLDVARSNLTSITAENISHKIELKKLKMLEPEKTQKRLAEQKKKNIALTRAKNELQEQFNKHQIESMDTRRRYSDLDARHSVLVAEMDAVRERMNMLDGDHILSGAKFFSPIAPELIFYPHVFHFGLEVSTEAEREHGERFVSGLDFHVQIRSTWGIDITVKLNEWGVAVYHVVKEFDGHWPQDLNPFLQEFYFDQIEVLNPLLHARSVWANDYLTLDICGLKLSVKQALIDGGFRHLASIGTANTSKLSALKGIGEKTADQVKRVAVDLLKSWDAEHGEPNLRKHNNMREDPALRLRKAKALQSKK